MKPMDAALLPPGVGLAPVTAWRGAQVQALDDWLADEVPVALVFNGLSHAVMLASPADLEDFALGFGLTEGLLAAAGELYGVDVLPVATGIELRLEVASACAWRLKERRRTLAGRTGCGLCGVTSIEQALRDLPKLPEGPVFEAKAIAAALAALPEQQRINRETGAVHAAAYADHDGNLLAVREDVGRHNALDKLVGAVARADLAPADGFALVTSRCSMEMVQKAATAGFPMLVAISAPTSLAIELAEQCGLTLVAFARGRDFNVYAHGERLRIDR